MIRKNIRLVSSFILITVFTLFTNTAYANELKINEATLIAGKNVGCSIEGESINEESEDTEDTDNGNQLISDKIPMPIEHQEYLFKLCNERGLDYPLMLSLVKQESEFNPNTISRTNDYGYMQINIVNHSGLVRELKTSNTPLDPYVNLNWGTHMMAKLNNKFKKQGYSGDKLNRAVLSAYNKGEGGFKRTGEATGYINLVNKEYIWVKNALNL